LVPELVPVKVQDPQASEQAKGMAPRLDLQAPVLHCQLEKGLVKDCHQPQEPMDLASTSEEQV
jgi:hypothetical protein